MKMKLYVLQIHVYFADAGFRKKHIRCFFPCLVWSPPIYSKSQPSYILNVSFGSQVSRICRSRKFRISGNLEVSEPGDLDIWKSGKLGIWILSKTVLCLFSLISGLRYVLDFSSFMFEFQPFGTIVFVSLVFGNPKAELKKESTPYQRYVTSGT